MAIIENFIIFTNFVRSIMCYVYFKYKNLYYFHIGLGLLAVNARAIIKISIIFPSIICRLVKIVKPSV